MAEPDHKNLEFLPAPACQGSVRKMDVVLVQGKMIRYVHIPDKVDAISNLQKHVSFFFSPGVHAAVGTLS